MMQINSGRQAGVQNAVGLAADVMQCIKHLPLRSQEDATRCVHPRIQFVLHR